MDLDQNNDKNLLSPLLFNTEESNDKEFLQIFFTYLLSITHEKTRERYAYIIAHFATYLKNVKNITPFKATGLDIYLWRDDLKRTGGVAGAIPQHSLRKFHPQSISSIEHKTSVLSAFFKYLCKPQMNGGDPYMSYNPVSALHTRYKVEKYANSKKISIDAFKQIINVINQDSIKGARDYALIYGYFITGRRNSEWVSIKWGDLNFNRNPPTYSFIRKGQKNTTDELPHSLWEALNKYLSLRYGENYKNTITKQHYIFSSLNNKENKPITEKSVWKLVKQLAKKAGLDESNITVHSFRHLHAESYLRAGASIEEIRARLWHKSLATTQRYASSMTNEENRLANTLDDMLET